MANQLEQVLKKTQAVYKQAAEELAKKLADFQARFAAKDKEKQALLAAGEITKEQYKSWLAGQVFQGKQWEAKAAEAAKTMVHANEEAAAIVNDGCMTAYAAAMNYGTYELEKATALKTGFTLYNRETVSRLLGKDPQLLPKWKIDQPKDYIWNYEKVKNAIIQGIIQGKPIPQIGKDLTSKLQTLNENKMRMFARTGMTGAHNAGRMDALHRAEDKGIKVKKKWLATNDDRTRDTHADLDGQIREIDEPFDSDLGEIMYPGDPSADPANVYNCRCTMVYIYPELEEAPEGTEPAPEYEQMTFDQWVEAKENQESVQGETKPETVAAEDARKPEPEIIAEAEELEQTEPEPEEDQLAGLSEETIEAIESYTGGEEFSLNQDQFDEIKEKMATTKEPMYRVETAARTASDNALFEGDRFDFSQQVFESKDAEAGALRSFTRSEDALPDLLGQTDDAIIYRTTGEVDQLPVDQHSQYDQAESLTFANGWEVTGTGTMTIDGKDYEVIDIRQVEHTKPEPAAAELHLPDGEKKNPEDVTINEIMDQVAKLEDTKYDDEKKNLLPMVDEETRTEAHKAYMSIPEKERIDYTHATETTVEISDLKTEQDVIFPDRLEDLAESFDGKAVSGIPTEDHDTGIAVAKYHGQLIVMDGNNRTNLAIMKGQEKIDVMLVDLDKLQGKKKKGR